MGIYGAASTDLQNQVIYDETLTIDSASTWPADSGTTTSTTADKLVDSGQNFVTTVRVGAKVFNTTDSTTALVTAIDSNTTLSLSADIMTSGEDYIISTMAGGDVVRPIVDSPAAMHLLITPLCLTCVVNNYTKLNFNSWSFLKHQFWICYKL